MQTNTDQAEIIGVNIPTRAGLIPRISRECDGAIVFYYPDSEIATTKQRMRARRAAVWWITMHLKMTHDATSFRFDTDSQKDALRSLRVQRQSTLIVFKGDKLTARECGVTPTMRPQVAGLCGRALATWEGIRLDVDSLAQLAEVNPNTAPGGTP